MPPENLFFLALVLLAFGVFALALAYGSAVAGGAKKESQPSQETSKATQD